MRFYTTKRMKQVFTNLSLVNRTFFIFWHVLIAVIHIEETLKNGSVKSINHAADLKKMFLGRKIDNLQLRL